MPSKTILVMFSHLSPHIDILILTDLTVYGVFFALLLVTFEAPLSSTALQG